MPSGELTITVACPCCAEELDVRLNGAVSVACHQQNYPPAPDTTPPTLQSAVVQADGRTITLTFSEPVTGHASGYGSGFDASGSSGITLTYASGDGTDQYTYTAHRDILGSEAVTVSYNAAGSDVADLAGNALASLYGFAATNNSALSDTTPPAVVSAYVGWGTLVVSFTENVVGGADGQFTVSVNGGPPQATTYSFGNSSPTLGFNYAVTINTGDTVTFDYTPGTVEDTAGNALASITDASADNYN